MARMKSLFNSKSLCRHFLKIQFSTSVSSSSNRKHAPITDLTEDELMIRDSVRSFAREEIGPLVKKMEQQKKLDKNLLRKLFENGFMGVEIPAEYGGSGSNFFSSILVVEEISKVDSSVAVLVDIQNTLINSLIRKLGSKEQKEKYLPRLARDCAGSFCLSEADSGSDAFSLKTVAKKDGNDYLINGSKMWISNSDIAEIFLVFANADPSIGYRGISTFFVERSMPGLSIGKPEDKLGIKASGTCVVNFENVRVPESNILGELGKG